MTLGRKDFLHQAMKKKFWGPGESSRGLGGSAISNIVAESSRNGSRRGGDQSPGNGMLPPGNGNTMSTTSSSSIHPMMRVTEDTPPDLLEGTMDLVVTLPSKKAVRMTVNRRTPIMDLLIQVTTAHKINPGGHIVQVKNERGIELPYKPSTPIGLLDTTTIDIVPKNQVNEYIIVKKQANHVNPLFEKTFRLQVHLPRNQLYVMRVGPRTVLQDILEEVCLEKNLDIEKYEIRHPVNLDEKLDLSNRLGDYGLQELTVVSRNSRINSSVSSADIMALQQIEDGRAKGRLDSAFKYSRSSVGDSSVSSESATSGRGISPSRSASDDSRSISPLPPINHPKLKMETKTATNNTGASGSSTTFNFTKSGRVLQQSVSMDIPGKYKKRAAPAPPPVLTPTSETQTYRSLTHIPSNSPPPQNAKPGPRKKDPPRDPPGLAKQHSLPATATHSRHSSDSSGYHEPSHASVLSEHQEHRRAERSTSNGGTTTTTVENLPPLSKQSASNSGTNLTSVSSLSSTSLTSSNGGFSRNKRKAPRPPGPALHAQCELEEEFHSSASAPSVDLTDSEASSSSAKVQDWNQNRQRSLEEVTVDVHDVKPPPLESEDDETETEKESLGDKKYNTAAENSGRVTKSSSSASSLSGRTPISESGSSTRSSPVPEEEKSQTLKNTDSSTLRDSRSETSANNMSDPSSIISRSSSANTQEALTSPVPLPQPRTKPRTLATETPAAPAPLPRKRPDREIPKESSNLLAPPSVNNAIKEETPNISAPPRRARSIGVKVFPDDALSFAAAADGEKSKDNNRNKEKHENVIEKAAISARLENDNNSFGVGMTKRENNKILMTQNPRGQEDDPDSDNLEENLELFEGKSSPSNLSSPSPASSHEDIPTSLKNKPRKALSSISSDSKIIGLKTKDEEDSSSTNTTISEIPGNKLGPKTLTRTLSDDRALKPHQTQEQSLNRWGNEESLHAIERERLNSNPSSSAKAKRSSTNRNRDTIDTRVEKNERETLVPRSTSTSPDSFQPTTSATSTASSLIKRKTTPSGVSKKAKSPVHDTNEDAGEMMTSSESEASYADSGLPATANVTPSPVSLEPDHDIDRSDKDVHSIGSSRRSSIHSDHSESWREILQAKVENSKSTETALKNLVLDSDEEVGKLKDSKIKSSSNFEMSRPQSSSTVEPSKLIPRHDDEVESSISSASDEEIKKRTDEGDGNSTPTRKLSKSESFSHNSEFDVKMKRKLFSASSSSHNRTAGQGNGLSTASGGSGAQLKGKSSYLSSSDEDVSNNLRFTSMQNLSNAGDNKKKENSRRRGNGGRNGEEKVFRKATSVVGLEDLAPDIAAENPELRQTFQLELEAQFEQWKEQFLQRHLGGSKSGSIDSTSNDEQAKTNPATTSTSGTKTVEAKLNEKSSQVGVVKKETAPEEISGASETFLTQSNENLLHTLSQQKVEEGGGEGKTFDPERPQIVHSVSGARNLKITEVESEKFKSTSNKGSSDQVESIEDIRDSGARSEDADMNGVERRMKPKTEVGNDSPVYRYTGPPSVQMGTWGERPRSAISVKKDTDYIMGMGQNEGKVGKPGSDLRPTLGSMSRPQSFNSSSNVNPTSTIITPSNRSTSTTDGQAPTKWAGIGVSSNAAVEPSSKNAGSIVSSWKQRMQESELERKQQGEQKEKVQLVKGPDVKTQTKSMSATNTLERPSSNNKPTFIISSASNTLDRPAFKKAGSPATSGSTTTLNQVRNNYEQPNITIEQKPSTNGLRSTQFQSKNTSNGISQQNGSFKGNLGDSATLDDKKKFFQGIKPAESPTKEVPLPAVNMKNNIATIQRVFQQRPPPTSSNPSTRDSSPSLSTSSSFSNLSNSSKTPDLIIGQQNSSSLMLQRVMKTQSFNLDNFRRTPSPSTSASDRYTPSPTPAPSTQIQTHTVVDGPVRISTKTNVVTPTIKNGDNKAIIIVSGDSNSSPNKDPPNMFKQNLRVTGGITKQQPQQQPDSTTNNKTNNFKINVNVNGASTNGSAGKSINITHTTPETIILHKNSESAPTSATPPQKQMLIVQKSVENNNNNNNTVTKPVTLKPVESFKESASVMRRNPVPKDGISTAPPPPPPPPADLGSLGKSMSLNFNKSENGGMSNGKSGTSSPLSPSPDPRAEIFSAISGGNFKLKKTGSTVLLQ